MRLLLISLIGLVLAGCSLPKNPELLIGKKCLVENDRITFSRVWIVDKTLESKPTAEQCKQLEK